MKHGNNNGNNGNHTNTLTLPPINASTITAPPPKIEPATIVVGSVEELLKAVAEGKMVSLSEDAKAEVLKFKTAHETLEAPKRLAAAEEEVAASLPKVLEDIARKHKVDFSGRKVTVIFKSAPKEGDPNPLVSFGPEVEVIPAGRSGGKRSGNGNGFKSHGEVIFHPEDGKEIHFASFGAMAKDKGWKMEGRASAVIAITNPISQIEWDKLDSEGRKSLPTRFRIETKTEDGKSVNHVYPIPAS